MHVNASDASLEAASATTRFGTELKREAAMSEFDYSAGAELFPGEKTQPE